EPFRGLGIAHIAQITEISAGISPDVQGSQGLPCPTLPASRSGPSTRSKPRAREPTRATTRRCGTLPAEFLPGRNSAGSVLDSHSVVVQDRAATAVLGEHRVATVAEQVEVEVLVGFPFAVALHLDRDGLGRLAGGEGQRAGPGEVVAVARRRRTVHG